MSLFTTLLYQPVLNALVFIYSLMPFYKDMGIALIIFTVLMDLLLSPLRVRVKKSEPEQEKIMAELKQAEKDYQDNYIAYQQAKKQIIKKYRKTFNLRGFDLIVEGVYFITLWWVFSQGLPRQEWNLLYSWIPQPSDPINLTFLNLFDLTQVSPTLNLISAVGLFIILFLKTWWKPEKAGRSDYLLLFWAPFAAYFISSRLPAGQEFFFTILEALTFIRLISNKLQSLGKQMGYTSSPLNTESKSFLATFLKQIKGE